MILDPMYFVFVGPAMLLALWAQWKVKSSFNAASKQAALSGMSGAQAAREILDLNDLHDVAIEPVQGHLSDHYDPRHKVLRLSPEVFQGRSLASLGIAAHEAGHAIQDAKHYTPLKLRNGIVPLASIGSGLSWIIIIAGVLIASAGAAFGTSLIWAGIALFSAVVVFQLVNLPVEYDASARAKKTLVEHGIVAEQELKPIRRVLSAAALTYVAATLTAVMTLLYYVIMFAGVGGDD